MKKLLITSTVKGEGKTVLSANLAISLAKTGQRVLMLDGDAHQGNAARILAGSRLPGLSDWWRSKDPIEKFLIHLNEIPLWLLPSGTPLDQMLEMLQSVRLSTQMNQLSAGFDWVIMDSPPWAPLADATSWGQLADAILLVAREARTPKRLLKKVLESFDQTKLLGIVLNDCSDPDQHYYVQYYKAQEP
jgi:receptor protein-tyrosine kinase